MSVKHELNQDSENQVKTKCKPSEDSEDSEPIASESSSTNCFNQLQVKIVNQVQPICKCFNSIRLNHEFDH